MKDSLLDRIKQTYPHYTDKQVVTMAMHLDMMFFAKICSKDALFNKSAPFHYEIADVLQDDRIKRANIMSFRGSAKCLDGDTMIRVEDGYSTLTIVS